jgi:hypothetical protein
MLCAAFAIISFTAANHPSGPESEISRDERLVSQAGRVLEMVLEKHPQLEEIFYRFD